MALITQAVLLKSFFFIILLRDLMNKLSAINKIKIDESIIVINLVKNVTNYWCLMARVELLTPTLNRTEQNR